MYVSEPHKADSLDEAAYKAVEQFRAFLERYTVIAKSNRTGMFIL